MKLWILCGVIVCLNASSDQDLDFTNVDVASLATNTYGTELLVLENAHYTDQKSYKFEDFFWTGSGDGDVDDQEDLWTTQPPAVVYQTSTVVSTVSVHPPPTQTVHDCKKFNCTATASPAGEIAPTPTFEEDEFSNASQQFWLLTVLKGDGKDPVIVDLKNSLARLYKIAFERQQERHLGILARQKRDATSDQVNVYIHEVNKRNEEGKIEVVYHVEMLGKPVDAHTAANDMTLVSDREVTAELGYPFEIKAEPYVKLNEPQSLSKSRNTWFVIGVSMISVLVLLLVLAFLLLGVAKRKGRSETGIGIENKRHVFERGVGVENKGLVPNDETVTNDSQTAVKNSPTYIHFGEQHVTSVVLGEQSSFSGVSSSSSSLDISPLMTVGKKRKVTPRQLPRPRAAHNKTTPLRPLPPEVFDSDSGSSRKEGSPSELNFDPGVMSPKSFLSMPSVKSFPRTNMPEPLNRVLEPVSVTNLDMPDAGESTARRKSASECLLRHGSVGTMEDPGVIGPIVWRMHLDRLSAPDLDSKAPGNVSRMRKRFHDLLDDTFSLFGTSRRSSPVDTPVDDRSRPIAIEVKSHSANDNRPVAATLPQRPKTTGGNKPPHAPGPSHAWCSAAPSPLIRPLSAAPKIGSSPAGILKPPRVNVEHVLAEATFRPSDPAISVIEAIKSELEKVALPGSPGD